MLNTIAASLILAAITGLTFLAYKHPKAYSRIALFFLFPLIVLAMVFMFGFDLGMMSGYDAATPFMDVYKRLEALSASSSNRLMTPRNALLVFLCGAYLSFLLALPFILEEKKDDKPKDPSSEKDEKEVTQNPPG
jgi:hypothetical protein